MATYLTKFTGMVSPRSLSMPAKKRLAKFMLAAYSFLIPVQLFAFDVLASGAKSGSNTSGGGGGDLGSAVDSIQTNIVTNFAGPIASFGILMFVIGFIGWLFTTEKRKMVFQSIWIGGAAGAVLFGNSATVFNAIVSTIKTVAGMGGGS